MTDDRKANGPDGSKLPAFVFAWQQSDRDVDNLLIWPLAETRPHGAFARFLVIGSERNETPFVVPMDLESGGRPPAPGARVRRNAGALPDSQTEASRSPRMPEDLGSLPLLLRLPFEDQFTVTVRYLVRHKLDGTSRVAEVDMPPFKFRRSVEANRFTTIGFIRGQETDGPARPIVVTGIERPTDESGGETSMHIEMVDTVLRAYETGDGGGERRIAAGFVLAIPHADDQAIGPARAILPYAGARVRTKMEIVRRARPGQAGAESDLLQQPRFNLRIGASQGNRDLLARGIIFFHWNRMIGFARSEYGTAAVRTELAQPVTLYQASQGVMKGKDLSFTFDKAGFGDIVGVMSGPSDVIVPVFSDWPNNEGQFFRHTFGDWTITPFLWTGDELMPLNHYIHPDVGEMTRIANGNLLAAARLQRPPERADGPRDLARYLQPPSRNSTSKIGRSITAALAGQPHHSVIALDPYCELLRELDQQIKPDDAADEWPRLEELFSFAVFERLPELHRALVVLGDIRRAILPDFGGEAAADINLLAVVMTAIGLNSSSSQPAARWLKALSPANIIAGWEVMKCDRDLLPKLVGLSVAPDLTILSDCFDGRAAKKLEIYANCPLAELLAAAQTRHAMGHRHHAALLREVHDHRRDNGSRGNLLPYEKISAVVELLETRPAR